MIVAEFKLTRRTHHAVRFDPADGGNFQDHAVRRHNSTGGTEHADQAHTGIGRAAHDLERPIAGIDAEHLQFVGLRVWRGAQHLGNAECAQFFGSILDAFDL